MTTQSEQQVQLQTISLDFQSKSHAYQAEMRRFLTKHQTELALPPSQDICQQYLDRAFPHNQAFTIIMANITTNYSQWIIRPVTEGPMAQTFAANGKVPAFHAYLKEGRLIVDRCWVVSHISPQPFERFVSSQLQLNTFTSMAGDDLALLRTLPNPRNQMQYITHQWHNCLDWRKKLIRLDQLKLRYEGFKVKGKTVYFYLDQDAPAPLKHKGKRIQVMSLAASKSTTQWEPLSSKPPEAILSGTLTGWHFPTNGQGRATVTVQLEKPMTQEKQDEFPEEGFLISCLASSTGWQRFQLEEQRREQMRLEKVKQQCRSLITVCTGQMGNVHDVLTQQLILQYARTVREDIQKMQPRVDVDPDAALKEIKVLQKKLNHELSQAAIQALQWSEQQAQTKARIAEVSQMVWAEKESSGQDSTPPLKRAEKLLQQARDHYKQGDYDKVADECDQVEAAVQEASEASFDESVRKEVVRGLLATLKQKGFVVKGPALTANDNAGGTVTLEGKMPSGKQCRFEIHLDGQVEFDMDGYEGRSCGKELEQIQNILQEQFGVTLESQQMNWKNPDKIAKGASQLPRNQSHDISG